jgi:hypothetical protein
VSGVNPGEIAQISERNRVAQIRRKYHRGRSERSSSDRRRGARVGHPELKCSPRPPVRISDIGLIRQLAQHLNQMTAPDLAMGNSALAAEDHRLSLLVGPWSGSVDRLAGQQAIRFLHPTTPADRGSILQRSQSTAAASRKASTMYIRPAGPIGSAGRKSSVKCRTRRTRRVVVKPG